ncbi:MAG TPA: hypothetical protein VJQ46_08700 [Gemmatimonadales bacterium]|nr:hypothetical protein [Gemmatimonadales bacterium]
MIECRLRLEFLGLPASGKSALSHALAEVLRRHGLGVAEPTYTTDHLMSPARRRWYKGRRVAGEMVRRPRASARALGLVARSRQRRSGETILAGVNWLFASSLLTRPPDRASVQIADEGVFQALWSVCFEANVAGRTELLDRLVRSGPCPDAVIVLDVGTAELQRRLRQRSNGLSRMDGTLRDPADAWRRARQALGETRKVLEALSDSTGRPLVLHLRNRRTDDLSHQAEWLAALVLSAENGKLRLAPAVPWPWASLPRAESPRCPVHG